MDVMNGPYLVYHDNGELRLVVNYYDGIMSGPLKVFYSDGQLKEEVTMKKISMMNTTSSMGVRSISPSPLPSCAARAAVDIPRLLTSAPPPANSLA